MFCCHLYCQKKLSIELVRHPHQRACWEKAPAKAHLVTDDLTLYLCQRLSPPVNFRDLERLKLAPSCADMQDIDSIQ